MSVTPVTFYTVTCDECGANAFEKDEFSAWSNREGAIETFKDSYEVDWSEFDGKHRCPKHNPFCTNCGKDAGELCGERDFLCPSCWEASNG